MNKKVVRIDSGQVSTQNLSEKLAVGESLEFKRTFNRDVGFSELRMSQNEYCWPS